LEGLRPIAMPLPTHISTNTEEMQTYIDATNWILTYNTKLTEIEENTRLWTPDCCDRRSQIRIYFMCVSYKINTTFRCQ
jgi:hypothetical protein